MGDDSLLEGILQVRPTSNDPDTVRAEAWRGRVAAALFIAWRNLTGERRRWGISAAALGIAACLVFFLEGVSAWITDSSTAYVDHSGARLFVAERGIDDLLFAQSSISRTLLPRIQAIPGVASVASVVTVNGLLPISGNHLPIYVVGFEAGGRGGPWNLDSGSASVSSGQAVIDRGLATIAGLRVGNALQLFSHRLTIAGISNGTDAAGDFLIFVSLPLAQSIAGQGDAVSYALLQLRPGAAASAVSSAVNAIPGVHALETADLAANDRAAIVDSFDRPLQIIVLVALVVGVLIAAIVLYTATVEHSRDYAVLKAIGAGPGVMYGSAVAQCVVLSICGLLLGLAVAAALSFVFFTWYPLLQSELTPGLIGAVSLVVLAANLCAVLLPIRHLRRVDPQEVFKA